MKKLLFLHNTLMPYRVSFFDLLSRVYDLKLVFTRAEVSTETYGIDIFKQLKSIPRTNYQVIRKPNRLLKILIVLAKTDCDLIVDSLERSALFTLVVAKLRRKPMVVWSEDWEWQTGPFKEKIKFQIRRLLVLKSDAVLVPGTKHKQYLVSLGVPAEKVFAMPNATDVATLIPSELPQRMMRLCRSNCKFVLYVGRLVERKGVDYLIEAFAELRKRANRVSLVIVGTGERMNALETLTRKLRIEDCTYFEGFVEDKHLPIYYEKCDVCVVPSISLGMKDPWVFVLNEAMHFGKPVIATDAVGASFDLIKPGINGFVVPEKNQNALCEAMARILADPELERQMGEASLKIVTQCCSYEKMVESFEAAVSSICHKR